MRYSGTIEAVSEGKVMAEVPGRVVAVPVQEGQWVEKGMVIARLDGDLLRRQLNAAQVQVDGLEKDRKRYTVLAAEDAVQGVQLEKTELALQAARPNSAPCRNRCNARRFLRRSAVSSRSFSWMWAPC